MRKIHVTPEQKLCLEAALETSKSPVFRQCIHCILLASSLGLSAPKLAKHFEVTPKTIYVWFNLWDKTGLERLQHKKGQSCKRKLAAISKEDLQNMLQVNTIVNHTTVHFSIAWGLQTLGYGKMYLIVVMPGSPTCHK